MVTADATSDVRAVDLVDLVVRPDAFDVFDAPDVIDAFDAQRDTPVEAPPSACAEAGVQFIYLLSQASGLFSFYPPTNAFVRIGTIACPVDPTVVPLPTPYSMGVSRSGIAYVLFNDGQLFRLSTATAQCVATPFVAGQRGFLTFGMGYVADTRGPGETLYVAQADFVGPSEGLGSIDTSTFALGFIGRFSRPIGRSELTGTGDGRLFAFSLEPDGGSTFAQIDPGDASVLTLWPLPIGVPSDAFAVAFWGGDFYIFTAPEATTTVTRYRPADGSMVTVTTLPETIVGAGVSTCAPE